MGDSRLSDIKDEILRRFQRPPGPMSENLPDGRSVDEATQGQQPSRSVFAPPQQPVAEMPQPVGQSASVFAPPTMNQPTATPAATAAWHAPMVDPTSVPGPYSPPAGVPEPNVFSRPLPPSPSITAVDPSAVAPPSARDIPSPATASNDPRTGEPNRNAYNAINPNNRLEAATEYRDALDTWKPKGHRSFGQVAKETVLAGANAVNANPSNPWAAVGGLGAGLGSAVAQPGAITREFELGKANQDISRTLAEQHARNTVDNAGLVPVQLNDGRTVMVPRAKAGDISSRQQTIDQGERRVSNSEALAKAHAERWDKMDQHLAAQEAQQMYNSGMADDNPDLLAAIGKRLGLPATPGPHTLGQIKVDDKGNYTIINRRTGAVTDTGEGSFNATQEAGRNTRSNNQINATNTRAANRLGAKANQTPQAIARANKLVEQYNQARSSESNYNATRGKDAPLDPAAKAQLQSKRENLWQQVMATYPGMFEADDSGRLVPKAQPEPDVPASAPQATGPAKPADDGKYHYTEEQIRAALKPGQTYEDVLSKLKARSNVVID